MTTPAETDNRSHAGFKLDVTRRQVLGGAAAGMVLSWAPWMRVLSPTAVAQAKTDLAIAMFLEPTSLDPAQQVWVPGTVILKNVVETLIDLDDAGQALPRLAESWEVSDDGTEWTWTLREGISFHDGSPLNADAVKFTFDRILDPATQSQTGVALIGPYVDSEVIDEHTIKMTFSEPYAPLLHNLSNVVLGIVSPTAVEEMGEEFAQRPIGTGPYTFTEWVRGTSVTLTKWPDYVNSSSLTTTDQPVLETLVIKFIPEDQTRFAALRNGEANYMFRLPSLDVESIRADPAYQTFENMFTGAPTMFLINRQLAPTDDLAVAKAIQFAVNKDVITRIATAGVSPVAWGPLKPSNWSYNTAVEELYRFDPAQAAALLDEAGWVAGADGIREKDGQRAHLVCNVKTDAVTVSMLEAMQGMLADVGLELEIVTMSLAASEDLARQGLNNFTFMDWRGTDPDILTVHYHSSGIGGWNMGYFDNPELDALLDEGRRTIAPEDRLPIYEQAQILIMEEAATLPLFNQVAVDAAQAALTGVRFDATKFYPEWFDAQWTA